MAAQQITAPLSHHASILYNYVDGHFIYIYRPTERGKYNLVGTCIILPDTCGSLQTLHHHISDAFLCQQVLWWFAYLCGLLNIWNNGNHRYTFSAYAYIIFLCIKVKSNLVVLLILCVICSNRRFQKQCTYMYYCYYYCFVAKREIIARIEYVVITLNSELLCYNF